HRPGPPGLVIRVDRQPPDPCPANRHGSGLEAPAPDPVEPAFELDLAVDSSRELGLDGMALCRAAGRHPAAARWRQDQRPPALADEREPPLFLDGSVPELQPELLQ